MFDEYYFGMVHQTNNSKSNVIPLKRPVKRPPGRRKRKHRGLLKWVGLAVATLAAIAAYYYFSPARVIESIEIKSEFVRIIDADTLAVEGTSIRLKGIAAPEKGHSTFTEGRLFLGKLLRKSTTVVCHLTSERTFERRVGRCHFKMKDDATTDIQQTIVAAGYARACPRFGGWRYWLDETAQSRSLPFPGYCWGLSLH